MFNNKVNGSEDAVVSEMIKQLPLVKIYIITKCFSRTLYGSDGGAKFAEDCGTGVLAETGCRAKERDQKLQGHRADISDVKVVRIVHYSSPGAREGTWEVTCVVAWVGLERRHQDIS